MTDSAKHPLAIWMESQQPPLKPAKAATILEVSEPYLSQVLSWKKAVTLKRAVAWSKITGVPVERFMVPEAAE